MDRSTKEVILPNSGAKVVLYEFLVNGDYKKVEEQFSQLMKPDFSGIDKSLPEDEQKKLREAAIEKVGTEVQALAHFKGREIILKLLLKKIFTKDGIQVTNVDDFIYNLSKTDGEFLDAEVEKIDEASVMTAEQKKN